MTKRMFQEAEGAICSFCHEMVSTDDGTKTIIIVGASGNICESCVFVCLDMIVEDESDRIKTLSSEFQDAFNFEKEIADCKRCGEIHHKPREDCPGDE